MYSIATLDIRGYRNEAVPNTFLGQEQATRHLAIVFPGLGYSAQMPVLYYPSRLLLARGADILRVEYNYTRPEFKGVPEAEQQRWFADDVTAAWAAGLARRDYTRITLVGKSIGTLALGHLLSAEARARQAEYLWLTPLLRVERLRDQIRQAPHRALFVAGTADPQYDAVYMAEAQAATAGQSVVIEGADHSLEIGDDVVRSIRAQAQIVEAMERFLG